MAGKAKIGIIALTKGGRKLAELLAARLPGSRQQLGDHGQQLHRTVGYDPQ